MLGKPRAACGTTPSPLGCATEYTPVSRSGTWLSGGLRPWLTHSSSAMNKARSAGLGSVVLRICWQLPGVGAPGLHKAEVHAGAAAAADPVQDAGDDAPPVLVGVEAEGFEVVQVTRGLRHRKGIRVPYVVRQWIGIAVVVVARMAQERDEVAAGGEAEPGDDRVLGGEAELVDRALLEPRPQGQQPDCRAGGRGV